MTFPTPGALLDLRTELLLNGTWTNISTYTFNNGDFPGCKITRGKPDESSQASPSALVLGLNNADGRFTARNPAGAYYPYLVKNTQVRVSVPEGASYLRIESDQASGATCPDSAGVSVTGDTEIQVDLTLDNWRADQCLCSKWTASGNQRSWALELNDDGTLTFWWSPDGTIGAAVSASSTQAVPVPALRRQAVKVTLATASGTVKFWTAATIGASYTQLGSTVVAGAAAVFDSTAVVSAGYNAANSAPNGYGGIFGKVHGFKLLSGIGGTVKASPDFTTQTAGATSFADAQANTWTVQGTAELSNRDYRFHGEVASWPQTWDPTGKYVSVSVTANGLQRRLGQSSKPLKSAMFRYWTIAAATAPVAYWPCEDDAGSSGFASPLEGGRTMYPVFGAPSLAAASPFACSAALPEINKSAFTGAVPDYTAGSGHQVVALVQVPAAGDGLASEVLLEVKTTGSVASLALIYQNSTGGKLTLDAFDSTGAGLGSVSPVYTGCNGQLLVVVVGIDTPSAGSTTYRLSVALAGDSSFTADTDTAAASSLGKIRRVTVNSDDFGGDQALDGTVIGHIGVQPTSVADTAIISVLDAWAGEAAGDRFSRLCDEEGISFRGQGQMSATTLMGAQAAATLSSLLADCVSADQGMLTEPRQCFGLGYRTRASLQNQSAAVTLDYAGADLAGTLQPADDDQYTQNDVTVGRVNGSSSRQVLTSGPLSVQAPPSGVGTYDVAFTFNLQSDSQCADAAGWQLNLGTVNQQRFPLVQVNLARSAVSDIYDSLRHFDLGDLFQITSPPAWLPPDTISQLAAQFTELLGGFVFEIDPTGVPASPYQVFQIADSTFGRVGTDGSSLHSSATSGTTSLSVDSSGALWTTTDVPFDIAIGGERITVTAVAGASSPQTFTVTRSVNGVVAAHSSGAAVDLFTKPVLAW